MESNACEFVETLAFIPEKHRKDRMLDVKIPLRRALHPEFLASVRLPSCPERTVVGLIDDGPIEPHSDNNISAKNTLNPPLISISS